MQYKTLAPIAILLVILLALFANTRSSLSARTVSMSSSGYIQQNSVPNSTMWNGIGYDYRGGTVYVAGSWTLEQTLNFWNSQIPLILKAGLNSVRLSFAFPDSGGTTHNFMNYTLLNEVLHLLDTNGLVAILDLHNWQDMYGFFGSEAWINDWADLARHFKGDARVAAYELFNEPSQQNWASEITGDGAGIYDGSDSVSKALAECVDAIRATGDNHTIVYPDPYFWRTWNDAWATPSAASWLNSSSYRTDIVVSFHKYANDLDKQVPPYPLSTYENDVKKAISAWKASVPVWLGEFGLINDEPNENTFNTDMVQYCKVNGIGFGYWMFHPSSIGLANAWSHLNSLLLP